MSVKTESKLEVCESLLREHRQMEEMLARLEQALTGIETQTPGIVEPVRSLMAQIEPEMNTHFACEEQALFPGVEPYHSMVLMEVEHEELIALRDGLLTLIRKPDVTAAEMAEMKETGIRFINEMLDHIAREDAGIFPTCERALSDSEKQDIIEKMDQIRAEAKVQPTPSISRPDRSFEVLQADLESPTSRPVLSSRLLDADGVEIKHLVVQAGKSIPAHWSPKQGYLFCLKGEGTFTSNGQSAELKPGVTIVMSPQLLHSVQAKSDCHLLLLLRA